MTKINPSREKILQSAILLFGQFGYDSTSVQQICSDAGVSKGAFYHYFSTKQNLFLTLMEEWAFAEQQRLSHADTNGKQIPDVLLDMTARAGPIIDSIPNGFPILLEFWKQANLDSLAWKKAITPYRSYLDFFKTRITEGIQEKTMDPNIDPESTAHLLLAFAIGYLFQVAIDPAKKDWQTSMAQGMSMLLDGIRSKKI